MRIMKVVALICVLITFAVGTANAEDVDPTGKLAIGLQARGGIDLASKGSIEGYPGFEGEFSHPLGFDSYVGRYYASPTMDLEFTFNVYSWSMKESNYELTLTNIPLSIGLFLRSSLGDAAHMRGGGRLNVDILSASMKTSSIDDSETELTLSGEAALGVEWFITKHFSLMPEVTLALELPNEVTNGDITTLATGFQFTITVIP